jgi:hypothetical protein
MRRISCEAKYGSIRFVGLPMTSEIIGGMKALYGMAVSLRVLHRVFWAEIGCWVL